MQRPALFTIQSSMPSAIRNIKLLYSKRVRVCRAVMVMAMFNTMVSQLSRKAPLLQTKEHKYKPLSKAEISLNVFKCCLVDRVYCKKAVAFIWFNKEKKQID